MKTRLFTSASAVALLAVAMLSLTGCESDDAPWWGSPGYGWNFQDSRLLGYWKLAQYNGDAVADVDANYLYFGNNNYGIYYYTDNSAELSEQLRYWCQNSVSGASNFQINIQYQYSSPLTTSYWFTNGNDNLWMQWQTGGGRVQTYLYSRIDSAPW